MKTTEQVLTALFTELEEEAESSAFHRMYWVKQANQIIRKHFEAYAQHMNETAEQPKTMTKEQVTELVNSLYPEKNNENIQINKLRTGARVGIRAVLKILQPNQPSEGVDKDLKDMIDGLYSSVLACDPLLADAAITDVREQVEGIMAYLTKNKRV